MCGKKTDPRKSMARTGTLSEEKYCLEVIAKTQTIQTWLYRENQFSANPYSGDLTSEVCKKSKIFQLMRFLFG